MRRGGVVSDATSPEALVRLRETLRLLGEAGTAAGSGRRASGAMSSRWRVQPAHPARNGLDE